MKKIVLVLIVFLFCVLAVNAKIALRIGKRAAYKPDIHNLCERVIELEHKVSRLQEDVKYIKRNKL